MGHAERDDGRPGALLIAGPTASGKSALALRLAQRLGGHVVNADSMQVYRDLRILTARPTEAETQSVPHALYGTVDAACNHSVSRWLQDAAAALAAAHDAWAVPIFVGGTGLYLKALTQGLSAIPPVPDDVRATVRAWAAGRAPESLHAELVRRDPLTASRLKPTDPQRLLRALEVHEATGVGLATFQERREAPLLGPGTWRGIALTIDRPTLHGRIDRRLDGMVAEGALTEVAALAERSLGPSLPAMRAIGVPSLLRHVKGVLSLEDALAEAKRASRQYVKRQETFARHQLAGFTSVEPEAAEAVLLDVEAVVSHGPARPGGTDASAPLCRTAGRAGENDAAKLSKDSTPMVDQV